MAPQRTGLPLGSPAGGTAIWKGFLEESVEHIFIAFPNFCKSNHARPRVSAANLGIADLHSCCKVPSSLPLLGLLLLCEGGRELEESDF